MLMSYGPLYSKDRKKPVRKKHRFYYVYVDYATKGERSGQPYYVGMGIASRLEGKARNNLHFDIAMQYGHRREVILTAADKMYALMIEAQKIVEFKTLSNGEWGANEQFWEICLKWLASHEDKIDQQVKNWHRKFTRTVTEVARDLRIPSVTIRSWNKKSVKS